MINIAIKLATSITYTADGSQTNFSVPFDYLRPSFVHVSVNDAEVSEGFTISNRMVMFDSAPAKDAVVHIYRSTPTTRLVSWTDASILKAIDMTIAEVQQLHILEEGQDWSKTNSIILDRESGAWQGRNYRISNITDPTEAQDVVTKHYLENTEDSFVQRMNAIKTQTEQFANTAGNSKDSAYKSAQSASVSAASAAESAKLAEGYKNIAETAKSNASLYAANAKTSADNAGASKEAAQSAATTASNFASAARNSAGEAKTYKDNAKIYMDDAKTYMDNAKNYSENVNVFVPSVSSAGVLSWTNKAGLTNPKSVNIKGAKGDTGTAATITIGSVTTGEPGTNVVVSNSGTSTNAILNFQIPRGTPGADGGVTVDEVLNATSFNPIANRTVYAALQDKVSQTDLNELALTSGTLTTPSSSKAFVSKIVNDTLAPINNITQLTIEQSADGETWETLFDSATTTDEKWKKAYVSGLIFPSYLNITKGYMARITFATHTTTYFSSISFYMKAINSNDNYGSPYKCYYGFNTLDTTVAKVSGSINTWGSWANTIFKNTSSNIVQYVFNEDKNEDITLLFGGALCKGTKAYRNVLNYDSDKGSTVTEYPVEAPAFIGNLTGTADKATSDGAGNVITETYAKKDTVNKWNALQSFKQVLLGAERYLSTVVSGTSHTPQMSVMHYIATGTFTLNLQKIEASLEPSNSSVFTAYIESSADYPLHIETAGALKYIGSASDVAITSAGLLLNILMMKDSSGNVTSIVQAIKLEGGA